MTDDALCHGITSQELDAALPPAVVDKQQKRGRPKGGHKMEPEEEKAPKSRQRRPSVAKIPLPAPEPAQLAEIQGYARSHAMGLASVLLEIAHSPAQPTTGRIKAALALMDLAGYTLEGKRSPALDFASLSQEDFKKTFEQVVNAKGAEDKTDPGPMKH